MFPILVRDTKMLLLLLIGMASGIFSAGLVIGVMVSLINRPIHTPEPVVISLEQDPKVISNATAIGNNQAGLKRISEYLKHSDNQIIEMQMKLESHVSNH